MFDIIILSSPLSDRRTDPGRSITDNLMAVLILTAGPTVATLAGVGGNCLVGAGSPPIASPELTNRPMVAIALFC